MLTSERLYWIDYLKCVAIFFVIFGHISKPGLHEYDIVYSFHMPLFFTISGFLTSIKLSFKEHIVKQFKSLIVPTWILSLIVLPMDIARMYPPSVQSLSIYIFNFVTCNLYWFIPALFFMKVVFYPVMKSGNHLMIGVIVMSSILIGYIFGDIENQSTLVNCILSRFRFVPFFLIGFSLRRHLPKLEVKKSLSTLLISTSFFGVFMISYSIFGSGEMNRLTTPLNLVLFYLQAALVITSLYLLARIINCNEKATMESVVTISNSTLLIYILHFIPVVLFRQIIDVSTLEAAKRIPVELIISLMIFFMFLPISRIILNKYPQLLGKTK